MRVLKRFGRYLVAHPKVAQFIPRRDTFTHLTVFCGADHAGCVPARTSTIRVVVAAGKCSCNPYAEVNHSSRCPPAKPSAYYGLVSAVRDSLAEQSLASDGGMKVGICILMDATAEAALVNRRGFGRVKHLSTIFFWVQDHIVSGRIHVDKAHTLDNPADAHQACRRRASLRCGQPDGSSGYGRPVGSGLHYCDGLSHEALEQ